MPRLVLFSFLHLVSLMAVWLGWMVTTGLVLTRNGDSNINVGVTLLLTALAWAMVTASIPELARRACTWQIRAVGTVGVIGIVGLLVGTSPAVSIPEPALLIARGVLGFFGILLVLFAPVGEGQPSQFFLIHRHASDFVARRSLVAAAGHALLVALAIKLKPDILERTAIAYTIAALLALWQRYPQRAAGFLPVGGVLATIALLCAWIAPASEWPLIVLGFALGLAHSSPRNDLLASAPASQRAVGMILMALFMAVGGAAGFALADLGPPAGFAVALLLTVAAVIFFARDLVELAVEPLLAIMNPIRGCGPGLKILPTRGPVLVLANHAAWFDPLWVAKLVPLRMRPLMTSRFFDLPIIAFLMRRVFHAIRVPETGFRREAPEIADAIAALDRGESVLIFPEGWLRRKEELPLKRFGQGIYQILREKPQTPVIVCWIEGSWGSYVSHKGGAPTKNKRPDLFHVIRIGICEPQVLSLEMLHDHRATRSHLMHECVRARTFLGLPEVPLPPFRIEDDANENGEK